MLETLAFRGALPPGPPTRASALNPMGALGVPQTPRRSSLIAHSFTSSYAPDDMHDPDYEPVESSTSKLLRIWNKGEYILDAFWKSWKHAYLLSLRERTQTQLTCGRIL